MPEQALTTRFFVQGQGTSIMTYTRAEVDSLLRTIRVAAGEPVPPGESRFFEGRQVLNSTGSVVNAGRQPDGQLVAGLIDVTAGGGGGPGVLDYADEVADVDALNTPIPADQLDYSRYVESQRLVYTTIDGGVNWITNNTSYQREGQPAPDRPSTDIARPGQIHFTLDGQYSVNAPEGWTLVAGGAGTQGPPGPPGPPGSPDTPQQIVDKLDSIDARTVTSAQLSEISNLAATYATANQVATINASVESINAILSSDDATLDTAQERVDRINQLLSEIQTLAIADVSGLQVALDAANDLANSTGTLPAARVTGLPPADTPQQIADKYHLVVNQFTDADRAKLINALLRSGGTLTGDLDFDFNSIIALAQASGAGRTINFEDGHLLGGWSTDGQPFSVGNGSATTHAVAVGQLGEAAFFRVGALIGRIPAVISVNGSAGLPALDGSLLTGVVAFPFLVSLIDADNDGSFTFRGGEQDGDGYIVRRSKADQSQTQAGPFPIGELNTRFANRANEVYA